MFDGVHEVEVLLCFVYSHVYFRHLTDAIDEHTEWEESHRRNERKKEMEGNNHRNKNTPQKKPDEAEMENEERK